MPSQFVIAARKYRPISFSRLKGQPHVTQTLLNALKYQTLSQAFIFCGPKGSGKTSCARILAKAINCQSLKADGEPCLTCKSCQIFQKGKSLNLYELDAASNNSVEDIRQLIEQVRYHTSEGKKVFIIDEVHMLSQAAFNAFLKTLEEPPAHVTFILATTEKHKILPTILSRCQIFDFHAHPVVSIQQHLEEIAKKEQVAYEEEAFEVIAQQADGSLRDALTLYDLVITFQGGEKITYLAALKHLHLLDPSYYFRITKSLLIGSLHEVLVMYGEAVKNGFSGLQFLTGLLYHFRNLIIINRTPALPLIQVPSHLVSRYKKEGPDYQSSWLENAVQSIHQCALQYKQSPTPQLDIELLLLSLLNNKASGPAPLSGLDKERGPNIEKKQKKERAAAELPAPAKPNQLPKATTLQEKKKSKKETPTIPTSLKDTNWFTTNFSSDQEKKKEIPKTRSWNKISPDELKTAWERAIKAQEESASWKNYFIKQVLLKKETHVTIELEDPSQLSAFKKVKKKVIAHMESELDIGPLTLIAEMAPKATSRAKKPYSDQERWSYLKKKYPYMSDFKESFQLETI